MDTPTWIIAHDLSSISDHALRFAADLMVSRGGGKLVLAHAHEHGMGVGMSGVDVSTVGVVGAEVDLSYFEETHRALEQRVKTITHPSIEARAEVRWGRPVDVVTHLVEDLHAELLVVGSHGRSGFKRMVLGSVAEQLARAASCAVLLVKPPRA